MEIKMLRNDKHFWHHVKWFPAPSKFGNFEVI